MLKKKKEEKKDTPSGDIETDVQDTETRRNRMKGLKMTGFAAAMMMLGAIAAQNTKLPVDTQIERIEKRLQVIEDKLGIKQDYSPKDWIETRNGTFYVGKSDREFMSFGHNITSYAIMASRPEATANELDNIVRMARGRDVVIRIMHWAGFQPTFADEAKYLDQLDRFVAMCRERGIRVWMVLHHRERFEENDPHEGIATWDDLWGNRAGGRKKGELGEFFFVDDGLRDLILKRAETFLKRPNHVTGIAPINDPTYAFWTIANEMNASRLPYPKMPPDPTARPFGVCYAAKLKEYGEKTGVDTSKMRKDDIHRFQIWLGYTTYSYMYQKLRLMGVKAPINASALYGIDDMGVLIEMSACDWIDGHRYDTPWTFQGVERKGAYTGSYDMEPFMVAISVKGMPVTISETAGVIESGGGARSEGWDRAFSLLAREGGQQGYSILTPYAAHSHEIGGPPANNEVYDYLRDQKQRDETVKATDSFFDERARNDDGVEKRLVDIEPAEWEFYGKDPGPNYKLTLPGTQWWTQDVTWRRVRVVLPQKPQGWAFTLTP